MLSLDRQNAYRDRLRDLEPGWKPATEVYEATIRQYLETGKRILDAGCGRGGVVEQLSSGAYWFAGIDPDNDSLVEHRLRMPRTVAWLDRMPFTASSFDLVICSWVLEHLKNPPAAFEEAARVLKPGGHFITLAPNAWHPVTLAIRLLAAIEPLQASLVPRLYDRAQVDAFPVYYRANTPSCLQRLANSVGLETVAIRTISDPTYVAFNDILFAGSRRIERFLPPDARVHIVADFVR
ncbi:MAG: class I SAM-dependent methyltransferase [Anaerolineales bacterium]|nr:class I SAM-dependent methyltransferase [Anaerolineales bacterium]